METINPAPKLKYLFSLRCIVNPPMEIGVGPYGRRRCVPIMGGKVTGPYFTGEVIPGGADYMYVAVIHIDLGSTCMTWRRWLRMMFVRLVEADNTAHINTNYVVKSDDGAFFYLR